MKIGVIDYGAGNIRSVLNSFRAVANAGEEIALVSHAEAIAGLDRIVLPGVGAFASCRAGLDGIDGMVEALEEAVLSGGKPFLGICVGMQLLVASGEEHGELTPGLGWLSGDVRRITPSDPAPGQPPAKIPHMGWNALEFARAHPVFAGLEAGQDVYFVHSFAVEGGNADECIATTDYHGAITAAIGHYNIIGTQFHPEKSQRAGLKILRNFLDWGA